MSKKAAVPSAWDDDWESQADAWESSPPANKAIEEEPKISKAERLAKHAEANKKIWESAETPGGLSEQFPFLLPPNLAKPVPLATPYRAPLTLLSRKPAPQTITKTDPRTGKTTTVETEAEEGEEVVVAGPSAEELREKTQREREDKQRKYDEARARILGTGTSSRSNSGNGRGGSGGNSPRNGTPPLYDKGRGRGRGNDARRPDSRPDNRTGQKELFDPDYTPKPGSTTLQKTTRSGEGSRLGSGTSTPTSRENEQIVRAPRGPDATGRGFEFANRGGKMS
ncbi:hypothetical protein DSL72_003502 [Monilinia vaccinii-corymbosi]|uniref:SUZ-C domain-containing protein n=1 Tax=Monilinia vaccinii-corymbosi TaxID=61207 RepID=A0A8A3NU61_9HELO|nr:hypothetical protein DSL72_003502 [Monilinia vaccinii-corymbosi]